MANLMHRWPLGLKHKNWPDVAVAIALALFVLVFFDAWLSQLLQAWPAVWRAPFAFITDFGLSDWVLIPTLIVFVLAVMALRLPLGAWRRATYELAIIASFLFVGIGLPGLVANLLKRIFGRARPDQFVDTGTFQFQHFLNNWSFQSFPSGHATTAMATAFVLGFMAPKFFRPILLVAMMTGISRVVVGAHYPTDVLAGFVVGVLGAYFVRNVYAGRRWLFAFRTDGTVRFLGVPNLRRAMRRALHRARA